MLEGCPIPGALGLCQPEGTGANGVLILGEALGQEEYLDGGRPFRPWAQAGSVLERAIRRAGFTRDQFLLYNMVPTHPPNNWLEGAPYEHEAIEWGRVHLQRVVTEYRPKIILSLGAVATKATTGLTGPKLGIGNLCSFLLPPRDAWLPPVVPCFHPSFLRRGAMALLQVLIRVLRLSVQWAAESKQPTVPEPERPPHGYQLYPAPDCLDWLMTSARNAEVIAYDIETPYSTDETEAEERAGDIRSIQFSFGPRSGIYLPWRDPYIAAARSVLSLPNSKAGWNNWKFDDPLLRAHGVEIAGTIHDLMWAWHHLQPDLPRGLQFVAAQSGWPWPWKHLDHAHPGFYGIVDVDVLHFLM